MRELQPGLWWWEAVHREWTEADAATEQWGPEVSSKGFEFPADWANKGVPSEEILASLQPLLELPVELVLPTHGPPTDRAALDRALAA